MVSNEWITGEVALSVAGKPVRMQLSVPAGPVKPHRMLPIFQRVANTFIELGAEAAKTSGSAVSCRLGCAACCRQPIPLAEVEIYHIAELVESMPEPQRSEVKRRFAAAVGHFEAMGWFERLQKIDLVSASANKGPDPGQLNAAAIDYLNEWVSCPFLEDEACLIHENRPLSCREYLVTSPPDNCWHPTRDNISRLQLPISASSVVSDVGATGTFRGTTLLIQALELADRHPERFPEKTGERWAADFFSRLTGSEIPENARPNSPADRPRRRRSRKIKQK